MRRATPEQAKQAREAYAKHQQLVGELAEKLGGAEAREALVVGRNAVVRKWYIQHLDARQFWEAVLAVLGAAGAEEGALLTELVTACEAMAAAVDEVMASDFRAAVAAWRAGPEAGQADHARGERASRLAAAGEGWPSAPRFIVLGAQKCGTTTLWDYLAQHPLAVRALKREPHFFDWHWGVVTSDSAKFEPGVLEEARSCLAAVEGLGDEPEEQEPWGVGGEAVGMSRRELRARYLAMFRAPLAELTEGKVIGESTPSYLFYGRPVLERIAALLPTVRLLVILRDPTERAYSHYSMTADKTSTAVLMDRRKVVAGKSFEELVDVDMALLAEAGVAEQSADGVIDAARLQACYLDRLPHGHGSHGYVGRGLYAAQLEILFSCFPREQVLVLSLEQLKGLDSTQATMAAVYDFVGLPPFDIVGGAPLSSSLRRNTRGAQALAMCAGDPTPKNTRDYEPIGAEMQARLRKFYAPHNRRLYELLGRDLGWG